MKKTLALLLLIVMLSGMLAGCGGTAAVETKATPSSDKQEKVVVTMASSYSLPKFKEGFEAAHPEIALQTEEQSTGTINGEVARRLRNGHGPDLIITNLPGGEISEYAYDLSATAVVEKYQSSITRLIQIDGRNLFLPLPGSYYGYIVNKTLLDNLGLKLPETAEDLLKILATAKEKNTGVTPETGYGFGLSDIGATFLGSYFTGTYAPDFLSTADGARWLSSFENKESGFTGYWENSIAFLKTCIDNGYLNPDKLIVLYNGHIDSDSTAFKAEQQLPDRTAIMTYGNIEMYQKIQDNTKDEIVMLPCLPYSAGGNKLLSAVSNNYIAINKAVSSDEKKLNAALTVLDYLSTVEGQSKWIQDTTCPHSYLNNYKADADFIPESIKSYINDGMIYTNPFRTNLLSYMGKQLTSAAKGSAEISAALAALDDYNVNGSEDIEYDLSIVGTVAEDMLYENANTRKVETSLGNLICDSIHELTGADVVLVNGGGIRSSLYKGDVTGEDISNVCPYGNLIIVVETDGATLRQAITNGIQKTWKPAGQFLQVSGIKYSYKPAADETETAELVSLTYKDGTEVKDSDKLTVAYTNYMGGSSGYVDAGDGFTMLNVYDDTLPVTVKLVNETNKTYGDSLRTYFANHKDEAVSAKLEGRIEVIN